MVHWLQTLKLLSVVWVTHVRDEETEPQIRTVTLNSPRSSLNILEISTLATLVICDFDVERNFLASRCEDELGILLNMF